jgi:uncharacterized protein
MNILISGGTGFIGHALLPQLERSGCQLTVLTRQALPGTPARRYIQSLDEIRADEVFHAVINLAGASMAGHRWSQAYKETLLASRVATTRHLVALFSRLEQPPQTLLSASAIGYYGHSDDTPLDESNQGVDGFAHDLCSRWEAEALTAQAQGVRVCLMRLGVVLDSGGGAFSQMAAPFRLGVGNWMGSGKQWLSWIHRTDVIAAIEHLLNNDSYHGPVNLTAPTPVTSREFCSGMCRHMRCFVQLPIPGPLMRVMVGEMADELLLNGQRVIPAALMNGGFRFRYPDLDSAVIAIIDRR